MMRPPAMEVEQQQGLGDVERELERIQRDRALASRTRKQIALGLLVLLGVVALLAKGAPALLDSTRTSAFSCLGEVGEAGGDPAGCRPTVRLFVLRLVPHLRDDALDLQRQIDRRTVDLRLDVATTVRPNREARGAAARTLMAADGLSQDDRLRKLESAGAVDTLASLPLEPEPLEVEHPAVMAIAGGDLEGARAQIAHGHFGGSFSAAEPAVRAGALACLLGERGRGLELMAQGDRLWRTSGNMQDGLGAARLGILYCGGSADDVGFEPMQTASFLRQHARLARAYDPDWQAGRRAAFAASILDGFSVSQLGVGGAALAASEADLSPRDMLKLAGAAGGRWRWLAGSGSMSPWMILRPFRASASNDQHHAPGLWIERAAERFEKAAARAEDLEMERSGLPLNFDEAALDDPSRYLTDAARILWFRAAVSHVRAGRRDEALAALARVEGEWAAVIAAPVALAAGDARRARELLLSPSEEAEPMSDVTKGLAALNLALAHAALGDPGAAYEAAVEARAQVAAWYEEDHIHAKDYDDATGWLIVALALLAERTLDDIELGAPDEHEASGTPLPWLEALRSGAWDPALARQFWHRSPPWALPATIHVMRETAALAGDPEVVIDRVFSTMPASRALLWARAEAARWRGDEEAARRWQERAERIESLFTDARAVALAEIAGLW